jgi:hypothetical protein
MSLIFNWGYNDAKNGRPIRRPNSVVYVHGYDSYMNGYRKTKDGSDAVKVIRNYIREAEKAQRKQARRETLQDIWTEITDGTLLKVIGLCIVLTLIGLAQQSCGLGNGYGRYSADAYDWMEQR